MISRDERNIIECEKGKAGGGAFEVCNFLATFIQQRMWIE